MIDQSNPDFKKGMQLFKDGVKYGDKRLTHNNKAMQGYIFEEKISRCGFTYYSWNRTKGYKTSADIRTLFV